MQIWGRQALPNLTPRHLPGSRIGKVKQAFRSRDSDERISLLLCKRRFASDAATFNRWLVEYSILERIVDELPQLATNSREQQFKARAEALLPVFAPDDPFADSLLKWAKEDARAQEEFLSRIPALDSKGIAERAGYSFLIRSMSIQLWRCTPGA